MWQWDEKGKKKERKEGEEDWEDRTWLFCSTLSPQAGRAFIRTCIAFDLETLPSGLDIKYSQRFSYIALLI